MIDLWKNRNWKVMLLKNLDKPFDSDDYLYELKFDGVRCVCFVNKDEITLVSRNGVDITYLFPELKRIKTLVDKNVIFDGEIVALQNGKPSFSKLQERLHLKNERVILNSSKDNPIGYVAFDILYENVNLIDKSLVERKKILDKYLENEVFIKSAVFSQGVKLFNEVKKKNLEGIVAKLKTGKYHINERTDDFIKIKNVKESIFYICGFIEKSGYVFSILLGEKCKNGYKYVGKVSLSKSNPIYKTLVNEKKCKNYLGEEVQSALYVSPKYRCEVQYLEKTNSGNLRHPVFKGVKYE